MSRVPARSRARARARPRRLKGRARFIIRDMESFTSFHWPLHGVCDRITTIFVTPSQVQKIYVAFTEAREFWPDIIKQLGTVNFPILHIIHHETRFNFWEPDTFGSIPASKELHVRCPWIAKELPAPRLSDSMNPAIYRTWS